MLIAWRWAGRRWTYRAAPEGVSARLRERGEGVWWRLCDDSGGVVACGFVPRQTSALYYLPDGGTALDHEAVTLRHAAGYALAARAAYLGRSEFAAVGS